MNEHARSPFVRLGCAAMLVGVAVHVLHNTTGFLSAHGFVDDYVYNGVLILGAVLCLARGFTSRAERAAWLVIGVGLTAWCAADIYWTVALAGLEEPPYPSIADAGWLVFYPALYVGVVLLLRARGMHFDRSQWLDGLIAALATAAVAAALVLPPILSTSLEGSPSAIATNLAYPVGDLLLISLLVGVFALMGWRPDRTWLLLGLGLVLNAVGDMLYLWHVAQGSYVEHGFLTSMWPAATVATALAAWQPQRRARLRVEGMRLLVVPGIFTLAAYGVLVWDHFDRVSHLSAALASAALLVVFVRMSMTFREHLSLLGISRSEAQTDALTGLGNRRQLLRDLDDAIHTCSPERPALLLLFDLNGFKSYNDAYGHPAGDALLTRLGDRLARAAGADGRAYRMGGDEFCVLSRPPEGDGTVVIAAALAALSERGQGFDVTAAYGGCDIVGPEFDVSEALRRADRAMYAQKDSTRFSASGQSMEVLVRVLSERNGELAEHIGDVGDLCGRVAEHLGLPESACSSVARAGILHDVGKAAIPDAVLHKPGPLDEDEWAFVRRHTLIGERIVRGAPSLAEVATLVRSSHERWDGGGYPDGLAGEAIPLGSRIVAVCDAYDAMIEERPYSRAMSPEDALNELRRCAGTQFDPRVVEAFAEVVLGSAPAATARRRAATPA